MRSSTLPLFPAGTALALGLWLVAAGAVAVAAAHPSQPIDGSKLYHKFCAPCHGDHGDGNSRAQTALDPPPRNFTTAKSREELSRERMLVSVTYGRPGTAMVGWKRRLSTDQIAAIVDYVRKTFMQGSESSAPRVPVFAEANTPIGAGAAVDMARPFPQGLKGDFAKGRDFYMHNCFTCHGRKGDGHGPRYKSIQPPPRDFLTAESRRRFNRPALFHAISKGKVGSVMPAWDTVLTPQQIANVGEFVFEAFIQGKGTGLADSAPAAAAEQKKKEDDSGYDSGY